MNEELEQEIADLKRLLTITNENVTVLAQMQELLMKSVRENTEAIVQTQNIAREAVWAEVFNNTITGSNWLLDTAFSPGRMATGYQSLYVLYRIFNEVKPKSILEIGLGQSTRLIGQYANHHDDVEHYVVENNKDWIEFFQNSFPLSDRTQITHLDCAMASYGEVENIRIYDGFREKFQDKKFDFIFIDAPFGGDMKVLSRLDVITILPDSLKDSFIILQDDADRGPEKNTMREIEKLLSASNRPWCKGKYTGARDSVVLASPDQQYICSL